jgi:hypothetical protein
VVDAPAAALDAGGEHRVVLVDLLAETGELRPQLGQLGAQLDDLGRGRGGVRVGCGRGPGGRLGGRRRGPLLPLPRHQAAEYESWSTSLSREMNSAL